MWSEMKIGRNDLLAVAENAAKFTASRSSLPVLAMVKLSLENTRVVISATNLEQSSELRTITSVTGDDAFDATLVDGKMFAEVLKQTVGQTIELNKNGAHLFVMDGEFEASLPTMDVDRFPPLELNTCGDVYSIPVREIAEKVVICASTEMARPSLQGVRIECANGRLSAAATDGFRVAILEKDMAGVADFSAIIPAAVFGTASKVLLNDGNLDASAQGGQIVFTDGANKIGALLVEGSFPNYRDVVPKQTKVRVTLGRVDLLTALKKISVFAKDDHNIALLDFGKESVRVSGQSEESGAGKSVVWCENDGDDLTIGFNVRFLREILGAMKSPAIKIAMNGANQPAVITGDGDTGLTYVVMPMHIG